MRHIGPPKKTRGEQGMAMLAAVICLLIVVTLSAVGLKESLGGISSGSQSRKLQQTLDAAEAGLQVELADIGTVAAGTTPSTPCTGAAAVSLSSINGINASYSTTLTPETSPSSPSTCSGSYTQSTITNNQYLLITSIGTTTDATGGGPSFGRKLEALVNVRNAVNAVNATFSATGQGANIGLLSGFVAVGTPVITANAGNLTPSPNSVTLLSGQSILTAGVLGAAAEAEGNGDTFACAGALSSSGATLQIGTSTGTCTPSGNSTSGVQVSLSPLLGALSGITTVYLTADAISAYANENGNAVPTGGAIVTDVVVHVGITVLGLPVTVAVTVPIAGTKNENLLTDIVTAIAHNALLSAVVSTLTTALQSTLTLTTDAWTPSSPSAGGTLSISALHIGVIGTTLTGDIGKVTVGPYTAAVPSVPANVQVQKVTQG